MKSHAHPIYEARTKVSEILRRVIAAASVTTFFLASVTTFLLASSNPNSSQPTYDAAIQEGQTAAQELMNQGASAVAIAFVDDKRIIWSQRFGLADRDTGKMPTDSTMFGTGSVSKMFSTIAVMQLVDRGVVDLDTPLVTYLPAFRMAAAGYEKITVRMLLRLPGHRLSQRRHQLSRAGIFGSGPPDALHVAAQGPARLHERLL
jgi:CubicO group peptidase (beta-lactamase class C family)